VNIEAQAGQRGGFVRPVGMSADQRDSAGQRFARAVLRGQRRIARTSVELADAVRSASAECEQDDAAPEVRHSKSTRVAGCRAMIAELKLRGGGVGMGTLTRALNSGEIEGAQRRGRRNQWTVEREGLLRWYRERRERE
jgi:hypothetical protein